MGLKNYEKRHYFMVSAIALVLVSPFIIWVLPNILHKMEWRSAWIIETHGITYGYFAIACLVLVIGAIASYFFYRLKIFISIGCAILAFSIMFYGIKPITVVSASGVTIVDTSSKVERQYGWEDVEKVYLIIDKETNERSLEFHYKDNETFTLDNSKDIENLRIQLLRLKDVHGFPFKTKD